MVSATVQIVNRMGLHARPASLFVIEAKKFESNVSIRHAKGTHDANAKSIMMVLTSDFTCGDEVTLTCDGPDEDRALDAMVRLIEGGFGEGSRP